MSLNQFLTILSFPPDEILNIFSLIISFGLAVLMFVLGLKITFFEIKKNFIEPKALLTGLFLQIILIPVVGLIYVLTTDFSPDVQLGIIIIACMPSAATSNYITSKINGDIPLSITLTSICTLLAVYTIPFYLKLFNSILSIETSIFDIYYRHIIMKIFIFITLPVIIGATLKHYIPKIKKIEKNLDKISLILFVIIIKLAIYLSIINIQNTTETFIAVFSFMAIVLSLVFFVIKLSNISFERTKTLFAEAVLQNNALGFLIVFSISGNSSNTLPVLAVYAVGQYVVIVLLLFTLLKKKPSIPSEKI
ncbi:hypothetical protein N9J56_01270 [Pelagibacteraceae bacterium]|nr:hypothetical protein [Pelagibacteraceae bacterium]